MFAMRVREDLAIIFDAYSPAILFYVKQKVKIAAEEDREFLR
jgi:hypothetical protein